MEITPETVLETLSNAQKDVKVLIASETAGMEVTGEKYLFVFGYFRKLDISKADFARNKTEEQKEKLFQLAKDIIGSAIDVYEMATKRYAQTHEEPLKLIRLNVLAVLQRTYFFLAFLKFETPTKNIEQLEALVRRGITSDIRDYYVRDAIKTLSERLDMRRKPPLPTPPHTRGRQNNQLPNQGGKRRLSAAA